MSNLCSSFNLPYNDKFLHTAIFNLCLLGFCLFVFVFFSIIVRKELIARLEEVEKESMDAAQLAKEYAELTEENRTLKLAQTQCVEQLEKLRIQYQKRQGSS